MRKITAAINMTIDGNCDHTAGLADEELHDHYTELLGEGDVILYGRTTYQLMEFWRTFLEKPSETKSMNDFAVAINNIPKIVFSRTLNSVDWRSASIANQGLEETVLEMKRQVGKNILVGSRSLITQLIGLNLIDEFQLCIQPVVAGNGLRLFEDISERPVFRLTKTRTFNNGAIILYYQPRDR